MPATTTTTTTTGGTLSSTHPPPTNLQGATPRNDHYPATAGQQYAPPATEEQGRGCETPSL